ncbi:MAG: hypothetical protein JZU53_09120 [Paludibacter sp.]|nr:hypothetical protein [Paludibacter sp.]
MNRKLLVTLLQKSIQELEMITEGFMEMEHYPKAIIQLAQRKTDDIQSYIEILSTVMPESTDNSAENEIPVIVPSEEETTTEKPAELTVIAKTADEISENPTSTETTETEVNNEETQVSETVEEETIEEETIEEEEEEEEEEEILEEETEEDEEEEDEEEIEEVTTETGELVELEEITSVAELASNEEEVEEKFTSNETITIVEETQKSMIGDKNLLTSVTRNELLSRTENTISSVLANKKIADIKQGINIGDRFRFQRELFRGNGEDMNKTLSYINQLATLNEALSFLRSKYGWATDNETAEDFYQIVKRRFL